MIWLVICLLLAGCSSTTTLHRDTDGKVYKVESYGNVKTVITNRADGSEVIEQDSKNEPWMNLEIPATKLGG